MGGMEQPAGSNVQVSGVVQRVVQFSHKVRIDSHICRRPLKQTDGHAK